MPQRKGWSSENRRVKKVNSLTLADQLPGRILDILQSQPRWASTMLIVHGDHSWRTQLWRPMAGWSTEDECVSHGGQWDPRPLVMIHAPGQQTAETVNTPTTLMMVHDRVTERIQSSTHSLQSRSAGRGYS